MPTVRNAQYQTYVVMVEASKSSSTIDPNGRARTGKLLIDLFRKAGTRRREPAGSPAMENRNRVIKKRKGIDKTVQVRYNMR